MNIPGITSFNFEILIFFQNCIHICFAIFINTIKSMRTDTNYINLIWIKEYSNNFSAIIKTIFRNLYSFR